MRNRNSALIDYTYQVFLFEKKRSKYKVDTRGEEHGDTGIRRDELDVRGVPEGHESDFEAFHLSQ